MKYKKSMFMLVLVIFLFAIATASASDNSLASDTDQIELYTDNEIIENNLHANEENTQLQSKYDETVSAENELDVISKDEGTYSDLKNEIGNGGNKNLTKNYYRYTPDKDNGVSTIKISTSGIIDGKGAVIDMTGSTIQAFNVVSYSGVTIKNLTIKNANYNGRGGAVYFDWGGTVTNCNFVNNTASDGGAVYFDYGGRVTDCNFTDNSASDGGAVYFNMDGTVENCIFTDNKATNGGAVNLDSGSTGTVINCIFTDNKATNSGGAVNIYDGEVRNCNFTDNSASDGGAVYFFDGGVINCNFVNNSARGGGAVNIYEGEVRNCNFTDNSARGGGAVYFNMDGTVENCIFTDNKATNSGGAVNIYDGEVRNCNFVNNSASADGGAVYFWEGNVTNCNFTDNSASGDGGAVFFFDNGEVNNSNFIKNTAGRGGAIYFFENGAVKKSYFKDNSADDYPNIYCGSKLVSEDNTFVNKIDIANAKLKLSKTAFTYNAKVQKPTVTLTNGAVLKMGVDYTLKWSSTSPKKTGTYTVTVTGIGAYTGTKKAIFKINKAANPLRVKAKTVNVKFYAVKKKTQILAVSKVVTFYKKGQGALTYVKASGNKKITINKKTGKVTVAKGLKKGIYNVKIRIRAAGNANYKASAYQTVTFKIIIK